MEKPVLFMIAMIIFWKIQKFDEIYMAWRAEQSWEQLTIQTVPFFSSLKTLKTCSSPRDYGDIHSKYSELLAYLCSCWRRLWAAVVPMTNIYNSMTAHLSRLSHKQMLPALPDFGGFKTILYLSVSVIHIWQSWGWVSIFWTGTREAI